MLLSPPRTQTCSTKQTVVGQKVSGISSKRSAGSSATAQFLKGKAYHLLERGEWTEAMKLLERALPIYKGTFGTNHNHMLDAEDLLARAYEQKGEPMRRRKYIRAHFHAG